MTKCERGEISRDPVDEPRKDSLHMPPHASTCVRASSELPPGMHNGQAMIRTTMIMCPKETMASFVNAATKSTG